MGELNAWGMMDKVFLACAVLGGALFLMRTILMFMGADHGIDIHTDLPHDVHLDVGGGHDAATGHDSTGSDASFKVLTFQGLTAFFLMFGLTGLFLSRAAHLGGFIGSIGGMAVGTSTMWMIAKFFSMLLGLQSSGTMDLKNAVGQEGTVYLRIPPGGSGKIQVTVQSRLEEFEATTESHEEIKSGEKVRVVFIKGNVLVVEKI